MRVCVRACMHSVISCSGGGVVRCADCVGVCGDCVKFFGCSVEGRGDAWNGVELE